MNEAILAYEVDIQGMAVLLADKVQEQEPQHKWLFHTTLCIYISSLAVNNLPNHCYLCRGQWLCETVIYIVVFMFMHCNSKKLLS